MREFPSLPTGRQEALCSAWLRGAREAGDPVVSIQLVRVDRDLLPRAGRHAAQGSRRTLVYECGDRWIRAVGSPVDEA